MPALKRANVAQAGSETRTAPSNDVNGETSLCEPEVGFCSCPRLRSASTQRAGYSDDRERDVTLSGSAVSSVLITVLR